MLVSWLVRLVVWQPAARGCGMSDQGLSLMDIAIKLENLASWLGAGLLDCGSTHKPIQATVMELAKAIRDYDAQPRKER